MFAYERVNKLGHVDTMYLGIKIKLVRLDQLPLCLFESTVEVDVTKNRIKQAKKV